MKKAIIVMSFLLLFVIACEKKASETTIPEEPEIKPTEVAPAMPKTPEVEEGTKTLYKYGSFRAQNRQTSGQVKIYLIKRPKEEFYLIEIQNLDLKVFKTDNLESTNVYLVADSNPKSMEVIKREYFDLGKLQSPSGTNTYNLPAAVDASIYRSIAIVQKEPESLFAVATLAEEEKPDAKLG